MQEIYKLAIRIARSLLVLLASESFGLDPGIELKNAESYVLNDLSEKLVRNLIYTSKSILNSQSARFGNTKHSIARYVNWMKCQVFAYIS